MNYKITTHSGSIYYVEEIEGRYFLSAKNVPNDTSQPIFGEWEIERPRPWPPVIGERMWLPSIQLFEYDAPDRMPGGGKDTSPVVTVTCDG